MSVEGLRHPPVLSALFGMKAEDSELLGSAELIRGTEDVAPFVRGTSVRGAARSGGISRMFSSFSGLPNHRSSAVSLNPSEKHTRQQYMRGKFSNESFITDTMLKQPFITD